MAVPFLKISKGSIVVLSSNAGNTPIPGSVIYSTSMSMLNELVRCTALETAFHGIRCNAVAPGITFSNARTKKESLQLTNNQNNQFLKEANADVPLYN